MRKNTDYHEYDVCVCVKKKSKLRFFQLFKNIQMDVLYRLTYMRIAFFHSKICYVFISTIISGKKFY